MELEASEFRPPVVNTFALKFYRFIYNSFYRYMTYRLRSDDVLFLNYGYEEDPPMGIPLSAHEERDRYFIQLYHRTAAQVDVAGKDVLEVGCGHGGGASYLARTLRPVSYTGLDLNPVVVGFCQKRHRVAGLQFVKGDAENLPFPDQSFDAVINVESSHLYPQFPRFLDEVTRVLRPGGHFLYADLRYGETIPVWEEQLQDAEMSMISCMAINEQVMRGMEKNAHWWVRMVDRLVPAFLRRWLVVRGYIFVWNAFRDMQRGGAADYRMYCFVKE